MPTIQDTDAIFHLDGERLIPTALAAGPWYPGTQHGSAMLGLLARAIETHDTAQPMQVTRFTADLMRAAPSAPVTTSTRRLRGGKSLEIIEAVLEASGETWARATAMRFRIEEIDVSDETKPVPPRFGLPGPSRMRGWLEDLPDTTPAFHHALEIRPPLGSETPAMWFRLRCPMVAGEALTPFVRCAMMSDWTYSVPIMHRMLEGSGFDDDRSFSAINPDTSVNLHRPMEGEWLCLDSHTHYGPLGAGTAFATLHDERGPIGHASQSILIRAASHSPAAVRARRAARRR